MKKLETISTILFNRKRNICSATGFIYEYARKSKRSESYRRKYRSLATHLSNYEKDRSVSIQSNSYNDFVCEDYYHYLRSIGLRQNTIRSYLQCTASMFRKMFKRGYEVDFSFEEFIIKKEEIVAVYLTLKELDKLRLLKLKGNADIVRDMFLIGCYTGMRYSDYSKLTGRNIVNGKITRKTDKTGEIVVLPIHPCVKEILEKRNGNFPLYEYSAQSFNKTLKTICKKAKLFDHYLLEYTKGNRRIKESKKKYELVCSHTARRSFATNTYLSGIPTANIMMLTGHKTEQAFMKYIRITKTENAKLLSDYAFFK